MNSRLILASASPRRKKILTELGLSFDILAPDVEEILNVNDARATAHENARLKHTWCMEREPARHIIAADTVIDFQGRCITKARDTEEALSFLRMFSGRTHTVYTAVAMSRPNAGPEIEIAESAVLFRKLSNTEIDSYFHEVRPMDRAGAYDIDELGEKLIESYTGSRTNIMGLPVENVSAWLKLEGLL